MCLLLGRIALTNLDSVIKSRDIRFCCTLEKAGHKRTDALEQCS